MGKAGFWRRRTMLLVAALFGTLIIGVPGVQALDAPHDTTSVDTQAAADVPPPPPDVPPPPPDVPPPPPDVPPPPPDRGTIIVEKQTIPDGDQTDFDFVAGPNYEPDQLGTFSLSDGEQKVLGNLNSWVWSVAESTPEGWKLTSATCSDGSSPGSIGLAPGETVTCTFVNTKNN